MTAPAGAGDPTGVDVIRSEERVQIHTVSQPRERIRLQKVIVTEERTITVTVRREELRVIREPLVDGASAVAATHLDDDGDHEIVLHEERVTVTTDVVPVERVTVRVTRATDLLPVSTLVRKERVELVPPSTRSRDLDASSPENG